MNLRRIGCVALWLLGVASIIGSGSSTNSSSDGAPTWSKSFGGELSDTIASAIPTADGGYLFAASLLGQAMGPALAGLSTDYLFGSPERVRDSLSLVPTALLLRANEVPQVNVKVMPTDNHPGGIGEVGLPPLAPALANAVARLTGKRVRALPMTNLLA